MGDKARKLLLRRIGNRTRCRRIMERGGSGRSLCGNSLALISMQITQQSPTLQTVTAIMPATLRFWENTHTAITLPKLNSADCNCYHIAKALSARIEQFLWRIDGFLEHT